MGNELKEFTITAVREISQSATFTVMARDSDHAHALTEDVEGHTLAWENCDGDHGGNIAFTVEVDE